jgi:hypothetical protein
VLGSHLWAERFDKPLADLFDVQDEIVARLAGALNAQLVGPPRRDALNRRRPPTRRTSIFQGLFWFNKGWTPASPQLFRSRAVGRSRQFRRARRSARTNAVEAANFFVPDPTAVLAVAEAKLTKALSSVRIMRVPIRCWETSKSTPSALLRASPNVSTRWRWIEISPPPMPLSDRQRSSSVARKKQMLTLPRPAPQSARYDVLHLDAYRGHREEPPLPLRASGRVVSTGDRGQPRFPASAFFLLPPPLRNLVDLTRRVPQSRPVSRLTRPTPFPALAPAGRRCRTTRRIWPSSTPFSRACARPASRTMTATRRLAAILAADAPRARASGRHVRKLRQRQFPSKAA